MCVPPGAAALNDWRVLDLEWTWNTAARAVQNRPARGKLRPHVGTCFWVLR